jgi:hypothetical protein
MRNRWTVSLLAPFALLIAMGIKYPGVASASSSPANLPEAPKVPLELDDGQYEGMLGLYNYDGTGKQFMWFNEFAPDPASFPFILEEVCVLFDHIGGSNKIKVGDAIELVVYFDEDGNPQNGAQLLGHYDEKIQSVDGKTWSRYQLDPPLDLTEPGNVIIGVVNRYTQDSVSEKTYPAMYDTTKKYNRSWYGWWPSGVSEPPDLASAAILKPQDGNWLVRGYGSQAGARTTEAPPNPAPPQPTPVPPNPAAQMRVYIPLASNR